MTEDCRPSLNAARCSPLWPSPIVALCAMGAFVMDVGSWFSAHRATQSVADAAALAGAQKLPLDAAAAQALAQEYGDKNGGGLTTDPVQLEHVRERHDLGRGPSASLPASSPVCSGSPPSTSVPTRRRAPGTSARRSTRRRLRSTRHTRCSRAAAARASTSRRRSTSRQVGPGAFRIVNIDGSYGGTGQTILSDWILNGYGGYMGLGWSYSDPGAKFNPRPARGRAHGPHRQRAAVPGLRHRPRAGCRLRVRIVGWVGFRLTGFNGQGNNSELLGLLHERRLGRHALGLRRQLLRRHRRQARRLEPPPHSHRARASLPGGMRAVRPSLIVETRAFRFEGVDHAEQADGDD